MRNKVKRIKGAVHNESIVRQKSIPSPTATFYGACMEISVQRAHENLPNVFHSHLRKENAAVM
jgi:hypothetical protein